MDGRRRPARQGRPRRSGCRRYAWPMPMALAPNSPRVGIEQRRLQPRLHGAVRYFGSRSIGQLRGSSRSASPAMTTAGGSGRRLRRARLGGCDRAVVIAGDPDRHHGRCGRGSKAIGGHGLRRRRARCAAMTSIIVERDGAVEGQHRVRREWRILAGGSASAPPVGATGLRSTSAPAAAAARRSACRARGPAAPRRSGRWRRHCWRPVGSSEPLTPSPNDDMGLALLVLARSRKLARWRLAVEALHLLPLDAVDPDLDRAAEVVARRPRRGLQK